MAISTGSGVAQPMKTIVLLRYFVVVMFIVLVWYFVRHISPAWMTLIALAIIVVSTVWLIVSIAKKPSNVGENTKSWWRLIWNGFWGL